MKLREKTTATLLIAIFMISIFAVAMPVSAVNTWTVGLGGPPTYDYATIQAAINDVTTLPGDIIIVAAGIYPEAITIGKANLVLRSQMKLGAIIRPTTTPPGWPEAAVYITADGVTIDGFEIDGTTVCDNGILGWETSGLTIKNNKIHGAVRQWDGCGILLFSWGNDGTVYNNLIKDNEVYDTGRMGIMVMDYGGSQQTYTVTSGNVITGNTVHDVWKVTWGDHGGGIQINVAKGCSITNNLVYDVRNGQRGIYMFGSASGNTITTNTLRNNPIGIQIWISGAGGTTIDWGGETPESPQVHYNDIYDNGYGAISSNIQSPNEIMDATYNWWGDKTGPSGVGPGTGDSVSTYVDYDLWLTKPCLAVKGGFDFWGYNYKAMIFNGPLGYSDENRPGDRNIDTYLGDPYDSWSFKTNDLVLHSVIFTVAGTKLVMKWSIAWHMAVFGPDDIRKNGDELTWANAVALYGEAWCTNHDVGSGTIDGTAYTKMRGYSRIVYVGDTTGYTNPIWGSFAIVHKVVNAKGVELVFDEPLYGG